MPVKPNEKCPFKEISVFLVNLLQPVVNARTFVFFKAGKLRKEHRGDDGVLIAGVRARQTAVTFLKAEHKSIFVSLFPLFYFFADELEPRQHVEHGRAVIFCDDVCKPCRNDGFDDGGVFRKRSFVAVAP